MNQPTYTQDELDRLVMVERGLVADAIRLAIENHGKNPAIRQATYLMARGMFPNQTEDPREARQVVAWYEACGFEVI
jgi:hypothetical protein